MTLSIKQRTALAYHLEEKRINSAWLANGAKGFPYKCTALSLQRNSVQSTHYNEIPSLATEKRPCYVINIPKAYQTESLTPVDELLKLIRDEASGRTSEESQAILEGRLSVVIGINRISSTPELNSAFREYVRTIPKVEGIAYKVIGFFITPTWQKKQSAPAGIFDAHRAYNLFKTLYPMQKNEVLLPISMQCIREKILHHQSTTLFAMRFQMTKAPVYFGMMDGDCISLRTTETGLFSRFDHLISKHQSPSVLTCGYSFDTPYPIIRLAAELDMKVREAMTSVIPFAAYFPEPCTLIRIRLPGKSSIITKLSFLGRGNVLESRRLIENALANGIIDQTTVFHADGGVLTATPGRAITGTNSSLKVLTPADLKQKQRLKNLRAVSQTHIHPKQWADNLYAGLDFTTPQVTDATTPMMHLFNVYDPISRAFSHIGVYSSEAFDAMMRDYSKPLTDVQKQIRDEARDDLSELGMTDEMNDLVEEAARKSGKAIYDVLKVAIA